MDLYSGFPAVPLDKNMLNILYLSCHSILEYLETKLLTDIGHNVFSFGSYINPNTPHDPKRPGYPGYMNDKLIAAASRCTQANLDEEMINWADIIIVMHRPDWITSNWLKIKEKRVIWRTIGQSTPEVEASLILPRSQGMEIVRYSPEEERIKNYLGSDALVRFYADEYEFIGYNGSIPAVMTVAQSMKKRGRYCGFDLFVEATEGQSRVIYGPDNNDTGMSGGQLTYEELKTSYRNNRCYFYTGTYPASYTLNFTEALMTGIPVVAIGERLANINVIPGACAYEVNKIIVSGSNGFCSDNMEELKENIKYLMEHEEEAVEIGLQGRRTAIELFGKQNVRHQWEAII